MTTRSSGVVDFAVRPPTGDLRKVVDRLHAVLGKLTSFADVLLLSEPTGYTVTNAAASPGTSILPSRIRLNVADMGADQVRLVARAENSTAGSVTLQLYNLTTSTVLATLTVTGVTPTTYVGDYGTLSGSGAEDELEARCLGDAAMDPVIYRLSAQFRILKAPT